MHAYSKKKKNDSNQHIKTKSPTESYTKDHNFPICVRVNPLNRYNTYTPKRIYWILTSKLHLPL